MSDSLGSYMSDSSGSCGLNNSGSCANMHDVEIYRSYDQQLTGYSKICALLSFIHIDLVNLCFENYIGFSSECSHCWTENVKCDYLYCRKICLTSMLTWEPHNLPNGDLNECLQCDEDNCGKEFLSCAGANRRNMGIITDIYRPKDQICVT